ncbi:MAG TPA: FG-GAP-like repeat-containing protein, partial [Pyrinomonadaceae bacterium]|nr:FG-GAP-like repeat-containing protein [Pyrinomonadaceae bacterium]
MRLRLPSNQQNAAALLVVILLLTTACQSGGRLPAKFSKEYNEVVRSFYIGLAALQVGDDVRANEQLAQFTKLVPAEPAGWANWGLLALRQRNFDPAAERLERARFLAPENDQIYYLLGLLESSRGRSAEAITALRKAIEIDPRNLLATYKLAEEIERQGSENSESEYQQLIQKMLAVEPDNLAILVELGRIAAKRGDADTLRQVVAKFSAHTGSWPAEVQQQLSAVQTAAMGSDPRQAATRITFLRNVLVRVLQYRMDLSQIKPPPGEEAVPFTSFLRLESPTFGPAPADAELSFTAESVPDASLKKAQWSWVGAIYLGIAGPPTVVAANGHEVRIGTGTTLAFPGGPAASPPGPDDVLPIDFSYDFKTDLVLAGTGGVRLMRQDNPNAFTDVTAQAKLPASVVDAKYSGAWAADIEADGDLDVVLGSAEGVAPTVLRNNGDNTFLGIHPFNGVPGLQGFAWADLDADGDPDAALIDGGGKLHVFSNERQGQFRERSLPPNLPRVRTIGIADINSDGVLDLVTVQADGTITRLSDKNEGQEWDAATIANLKDSRLNVGEEIRLRLVDLDNNGGLDLLLASMSEPMKTVGGLIWLSDEKATFKPLEQSAGLGKVFDAADLNGDGRVDLIGLAGNKNEVMQAVNHGKKNYHWQVVRPHASQASGDQRINPFGVGGEMEVRAGLMLQKQPITGPLLHFGLGEQTSADVIRVVWPNGTVRAEFDVKGDQEVVTEQRLKASCPFLFAYNGKRMEFLKDAAPWGSAIGLRINTLGSAKIAATGEWYKIGRDQLVPHDGYYDVRITAELWEVYYYDYVALMPVDHPEGTEIFVDERFVIPPAKLGFTTVATPRPIARATDDNGQDVTHFVNTLDGKALNTFGRGQYQGLTRDHYVEVELGDDAPQTGPLYLIAHGSIHDTESSLNVAITQGERWKARGLSLEVPDGKGGWIVAQPNLGFPAGRKKTVLFNLTDVFRPGTPRRVRVRTNLEIYWDHLEWAVGLPNAPVNTVKLSPSGTDLHYRGYSVIQRPDPGAPAPEVPDYDQLSASKQSWRDLIGYYTRFGEVSELLQNIDDRYVIVASGDEMSLRFPEQPPPPKGWVRDYVFMGDGWIKDGDYNSDFSRTVLPLPYHAKQEYNT